MSISFDKLSSSSLRHQFGWSSKRNALNVQIEKDRIKYLAAIIGKALKLDQVQTICARAQSVELNKNE